MPYLVELIYPNDESSLIEEFDSLDAAKQRHEEIIKKVIEEENDGGYDYVVINEINDDYDYIEIEGSSHPMHTFKQNNQGEWT